jgi:diguanylate cyclase (GGDEF)-like protein
VDKRRIYSLIYPGAAILAAAGFLTYLGLVGQFHWSYMLTFLTVACVLSEWLVIKLPQGDNLTLSIIAILLALLFNSTLSPMRQAAGALQVIAIGSLFGYALTHRQPPIRSFFYVAQYIWAAMAAGMAFVWTNQFVPRWLISSFHLPAVAVYTIVFSLTSMLLVNPYNAHIVKGEKLPKANLLYTIFLAPIAIIVYYFFQSRALSLGSLLILVLPLIGVLFTFRLYFNIDTTYSEVSQLYKISQEFVAAMSQDETVQKISEGIAQAMSQLVSQIDACLVYAHNDESNEYVLINENGPTSGPRTIVPGHGLLGHIVFDGVGTVYNDVSLEDALSPEERQWPPKTAVLAHPLFAEGQEVGLLVLVRHRKGFTAEEFRLVGIVANQAGVTLHNAQMYEQSLHMADSDRLLDVLNQAAFMQRAQHTMNRARLNNQPVTLLYSDIDDFRTINNTYGHASGDIVLAGIAELMKQIVGESGVVGRSGGEEFFILLPNMDEQDALSIANEIRQQTQDHVFTSQDRREMQATISTGVAVFPRDAADIASLKRQADRAAYLAKRMGKNRVCLYEDRKEFIELAEQEPETLVTGAMLEV